MQGRNDEGASGAQFHGHRITAWYEKKSQHCHKYFVQYSTLLPKDLRFEHGTPNLLLAPGAIKPR